VTPHTRWLRFNLVGVAGFGVQMLVLAVLSHWWQVRVTIAVPVAVLVAVSHNFLWHERVTWPGNVRDGRLRRWLSFNFSTGIVSVATNVIVTPLVLAITGLPLLVANAIAVVAASTVNFLTSDRLIFSHPDPVIRG
jgi:putative flippase GtrA